MIDFAIMRSKYALRVGSILNNKKVIDELTKDGSQISDWAKFKTPSITLSTGQRVQVHYYKNVKTGDINYNIDYKVKNDVLPYPEKPRKKPNAPSCSTKL